jgi:hypothetical protein
MFFNRKKRMNNCNQYIYQSNGCSTVPVNGKTVRVRGNNITISNDRIIVDGKIIEESFDVPNITVIVEGDCKSLNARGNVEVKGNAGNVDCSGSCRIEGNVTGNVDASGSVTCGDVGGNIDASGSVRCTRR